MDPGIPCAGPCVVPAHLVSLPRPSSLVLFRTSSVRPTSSSHFFFAYFIAWSTISLVMFFLVFCFGLPALVVVPSFSHSLAPTHSSHAADFSCIASHASSAFIILFPPHVLLFLIALFFATYRADYMIDCLDLL